jgi:EpsI family protein
MFGNTAVRITIIVALFPLTWWGARRMDVALDPPPVDMPEWTFAGLPRQLGNWQGENTEMDPKIADQTGANLDTIVNRLYRDNQGHAISMHTAMFSNPKDGVIHSPLNCYRSQGWEKLSETRSTIPIDDKSPELTIPVSVTLWHQKGEKRLVVYWYQLGKHVLFGRWDLGIKVRWSLAGKPTWPALIKVMLEIPVTTSPEDAETTLLGFAEQIAKWENQPVHRSGKGMLGVQTGANDDKSGIPP